MPWWTYIAAYLGVCVAGWLAVAVCMYVMRLLVLQKERPPFSDWPAFLGGAVERAVALTLVPWAPPYLPSSSAAGCCSSLRSAGSDRSTATRPRGKAFW